MKIHLFNRRSFNLANGAFDAVTGAPVDPYRVEAAKVFNVPEAKVTDQQRKIIKRMALQYQYRA